jgi:hypothetical protein
MRSFTFEYEHLNIIGTEIIYAKTKADAIKIFLKPVKNELVIIKNITDNGHIRTNPRGLNAYGKGRAY